MVWIVELQIVRQEWIVFHETLHSACRLDSVIDGIVQINHTDIQFRRILVAEANLQVRFYLVSETISRAIRFFHKQRFIFLRRQFHGVETIFILQCIFQIARCSLCLRIVGCRIQYFRTPGNLAVLIGRIMQFAAFFSRKEIGFDPHTVRERKFATFLQNDFCVFVRIQKRAVGID